MDTIFYIYVTSVATLTLCFMAATRALHRRHHNHSLQEIYIRQVVDLLMQRNLTTKHIVARSPRSRLALAEAIYTVVSHTYGSPTDSLRSVVERNRLQQLLLHRIRFSHGARRTRALMLLSTLPLNKTTLHRIEPYTHSTDPDIRISALIAMLANNPSMAVTTISSLKHDLSAFDIARIVALLRRGVLPIAYEPLLGSGNRNLRMLGLAIVRGFGIEIAEKRLHGIITSERDFQIISESIYTLASLGRPLQHSHIRERLEGMSSAERKRLCRHLSAEGYSIGAVKNIFDERESLYAESLINSYKRTLTRVSATR